jgi:hypothetical protein
MATSRDIDYATWTKTGFLLSVAMLAIGGGGELAAATAHWRLAGWQDALLFDLEVIGVLGMLLIPVVFGIALPLTE